jgi:predicted Zn-dependent protease
MKFIPRLPDENVNVSKTHPLAEFGWLMGGLILLCLLLFGGLGVAVDLSVAHIPPSLEGWLGEYAQRQFPATPSEPLQQRLDGLRQVLPADSPLRDQPFRILLDPSPAVNAVALPGNTIIVFAGLLQQVASENELAMVLAHELGHFEHRDHLRHLGRGLAMTTIVAVVFGKDSGLTELVSDLFLTWQAGYSRHQEAAADRYALDLLVARYGHAAGATDFFSRLAQQEGPSPPYLLASHPDPENRVAELDGLISAAHYPLGEKGALNDDLEALKSAADESAASGANQVDDR